MFRSETPNSTTKSVDFAEGMAFTAAISAVTVAASLWTQVFPIQNARLLVATKEFIEKILSRGDHLSPVPRDLGGARKRFNQKGKSVAKKRRLSPKQGQVDDWARVILRITIIPALFHHNFGGDAQGVFRACPFETLHQYQLGVLKYILGSLYNYRHIPDYFLDWISKRGNPDYPPEFDGGDTQNTTENLSEEESSDDDSSSNSESQPDRTEEEKFNDWILTRPKKGGKKAPVTSLHAQRSKKPPAT